MLLSRAGSSCRFSRRGATGKRRNTAKIAACRDRAANGPDFELSRRDAIESLALSGAALLLPEGVNAAEESIYGFDVNMYGEPVSLSKYKGQVLVVFGGQAPLSDEGEREYAIQKFGFDFDVYDKIEVNDGGAHPLYRYLKSEFPKSSPQGRSRPSVGEKGRIEWNYVKFLINRDGKPVRRYTPYFDPLKFEGDVKLLLAGKDNLLPEECLANPDSPECIVSV
ncbi:hypothetical protein BSKO_02135 [Bryopsis sp. KO-2023]|nr:hypothetical protein BSKO_02135 [Bryopsis sp. KO-2023]